MSVISMALSPLRMVLVHFYYNTFPAGLQGEKNNIREKPPLFFPKNGHKQASYRPFICPLTQNTRYMAGQDPSGSGQQVKFSTPAGA
jgi:hypothetical protein